MNSVFDITLNMPLNAVECSQYDGQWCGWCGKDNGGGKFCYECGKREPEHCGDFSDGDDMFNYLLKMSGLEPIEKPKIPENIEEDDEDEDDDYDWECPCGKRGGYNEDHTEITDEYGFTTFSCVECRTSLN